MVRKTKEEALETRSQVLDAAERVFSEQGVTNTSLKEIAQAVLFLASDLAGYITGTIIDISGGKLATQMPWVAHREPTPCCSA